MPAELRFPLDPANPGQFYACCGLIELFDFLGAPTLSQFEVHRPRLADLVLMSDAALDLCVVLRAIAEAEYDTMPEEWPAEESVKPMQAKLDGGTIELDWWLDKFRAKASFLKCWAGQVTSRRLFEELPKLVDTGADPSQLFQSARPTKSKFGVDPRSAWNARDFGYSPNEQGQDALTFASVEVLAAFGLQSFRPVLETRERVQYNLWRTPLPRLAAVHAASRAWDGLPVAAFSFSIEKRGSYKYFAPAMAQLERGS